MLGVAAPVVLAMPTTGATGRATADVPTGDWLEGSYTITVSAAESAGCGAASGSAALTVGSLGNSADGSGWYTLAPLPNSAPQSLAAGGPITVG